MARIEIREYAGVTLRICRLIVYAGFFLCFSGMNADAQLLYGNPSEFRDIVLDACKSAVAEYRGDDKEFAKTSCGMYVYGYNNSYFSTFYAFFSEVGKENVSERIVVRTPFCLKENQTAFDIAKIWIEYLERNKDVQDIYFSMLLALREKYPCSESDLKRMWGTQIDMEKVRQK